MPMAHKIATQECGATGRTAEPPDRESRRAVWAFLGLLLAVVPATLDMQVAATALPTMLAELGGIADIAWVGTGFMLASSVTMPVFGKLGDLYGRKRVFLAANLVFLAGSLACGAAQSMGQLLLARAVQGIGAGGLIVSMFAIIADLFGPNDRARFQGYGAGVFGMASMAAPTIGGILTDQVGWRWIFLINLVFGLPSLAIVAATLAPREATAVGAVPPRIDWRGATLLGAAVTCLMLVGEWAGRYPFLPVGAWLIAASLALLGLWAWSAMRVAEPVMPLRLFGDRVIASAIAVAFVSGCATFGMVQFLSLFIQMVLGASATGAGLTMVASTLSITGTSMVTGLVVGRTGDYRWIPAASMALCALAMALLATMSIRTGHTIMVAYLVLLGIGSGLSLQVVILAVQNAAPKADLGSATAAVTVARLIGATIGIAAFSAVLNASLGSALSRLVPADAAPARTLVAPAVLDAMPQAERMTLAAAYAEALTAVFATGVPVLLLGLAAALVFLRSARRPGAQ